MPDFAWTSPAPFAAGKTLGEALLEPTRIYVRPVLAALKANAGIKALAHITGGGFPDNIPRVLPDGVGARLDLAAIPVPPVFGWLARTGGVAEAEMLRTFNCGIGMVAVAARRQGRRGDREPARMRARRRSASARSFHMKAAIASKASGA